MMLIEWSENNMEVIDLKKYTTPFQKFKQHPKLINVQEVAESGFYDTMFAQKIGRLRKRIFILSEKQQPIAIITSLIPVRFLPRVSQSDFMDLENLVDSKYQVQQIAQNVMLTWANEQERQLLKQEADRLQVLVEKSIFRNQQETIIRSEEAVLLPDQFIFQKGEGA